jgi:2-keto-4-pentenoate hydratase/2-oxohepta-3-ene-1,7-dioic acid hydratase in catechol pathway
MKLVTYVTDTSFGAVERLGALDGDRVVDLAAAYEAREREVRGEAGALAARALVPPSMLDLLRREEQGMAAARDGLEWARAQPHFATPLADVRLRSPLPRPNSIRDFMLVEEHVRNSGLNVPPEWYEIPAYWKGNADAVFGPGDEIRWPEYTEKLDYELEMGLVVGRRAHRVPVEEALSYVAGYTILNDWSARDIQMREMKIMLGPGLGKDFAFSLGPCLVTPDELGDPRDVQMETRVNGEVWSSGTVGAMQFSFAQLIAHLSREQTLMPGDVLGSGTIGRGCGLELDRWIQPGDLVELQAVGIGVLANRIVRG